MKDITYYFVPEPGKDPITNRTFEVLRPKIPIRFLTKNQKSD